MSLSKDPKEIAKRFKKLQDDGLIKPATAVRFGNRAPQNNRSQRPAPKPNPERFKVMKGDPSYLVLLLDVSFSMSVVANELASAQNACIDALAGSWAAKNNRLLVKQIFFGETFQEWHSYEKLSSETSANQVGRLPIPFNISEPPGWLSLPSGRSTALYASIHDALESIGEEFDEARKSGLNASFYIGVVTDSADKVGACSPDDIKHILNDFREDLGEERGPIVNQSVIVTLVSPDGLPEFEAKKLSKEMGFDQHLAIDLSMRKLELEKAIRRAFILISKLIK